MVNKTKNQNKWCQDVMVATISQNLALLRLTGSEKMVFVNDDGGTTTDGDGQSSSADTVKQS